ncbi:MAG: VWA domain-containing protein [Coriobacteriales bacterium]|nr:VWA domain-containing protein [Coriobacteriales bacterium]
MAIKTSFKDRALALILAGMLATAPLSGCGSTQVQTQPSTKTETGSVNSYTLTETEALPMYDSYAAEDCMVEPWIDVEFNTEEYAAIDEGGFISTATRPLSTVSADVDTASWCNLRRMARDGYHLAYTDGNNPEAIDDYGYDYYAIPAGAVRIEEMLNYFSYDYAVGKTKDERFGITTHLGPCPWNPDTELLTVGFAAAPEDVASQKGRNLVFLIDVSGSMDSRDKLELLQDAFEVLVDQLDAHDRVSIVTYASGEDLVLDGVSGDNHREILRAIRRLRADGSTNGERGLELAYEVAERNFIEGGVNRIVMASDGDLNVGMTSVSDLHDYVSKKRDTGIYLSVLGFGSGNYKDTKMETLADDGNGSYHYIDCIDEAERVFGERLCANLVPFADDVKVQVEFNPAQVKAYRLIGYENRAIADEDFRDDTVDAGDVGPGAQFTVAYEIVRADSDFEVAGSDLKYQENVTTGSDEWLTATIRYHAFDDDKVHEQELIVDKDAWTENPGEDWSFQAAVIELGMLMRDSEYAGTSSFEQIRKLAGTDRDGFLDVVELL